jgi:hypothetical protein
MAFLVFLSLSIYLSLSLSLSLSPLIHRLVRFEVFRIQHVRDPNSDVLCLFEPATHEDLHLLTELHGGQCRTDL